MALENRDLQQAMEDFRDSIQKGSASLKDLEKETESFTKASVKATAALSKGLTGFAGQLATGDAGLKSFNSLIDGAAAAAGSLVRAIPVVGDALNQFARAGADAAKFLISQLDATAKSFNAVAEFGAVGAQGMAGLRDQFARAGLSLQSFQQQVAENSKALAAFRGLTSQGAEDFSKIVGGLTQGTDNSLRKLGMNADQIAQTTGAYIKQQTTLGRAQTMTNAQLIKGTIEYAKELDLISKLTGASRKTIQDQQDAMLRETKFRAVTEELIATGHKDAANELKKFVNLVAQKDAPELSAGLRDLSTGVNNTAAANKAFLSSGGAASEILDRIKYQGLLATDAMREYSQAVGIIRKELVSNQGMYNNQSDELYGRLDELYAIERYNLGQTTDVAKKGVEVQNTQLTATDALTASVIKAQQNIEAMAVITSVMTTRALPWMASAVAKSTEAMLKMYQWATDNLNGGTLFDMVVTAIKDFFKAALTWLANKATFGLFKDEEPETLMKPVISTDVQRILNTIKSKESGGAKNAYTVDQSWGGSSATGAYQFIDSTWREANKAIGGKQYTRAKYAPPEVQDAVAAYQVEKILRENNGDVTKVPLVWFTGNNKGIMSQAMMDANPGTTGASYQRDFMKRYDVTPATTSPTSPADTYQPGMTPPVASEVLVSQASAPPPSSSGGNDTPILLAQLGKLEEMLSVMKNQLTTSNKILQLTH